jgi:hypothetical protein
VLFIHQKASDFAERTHFGLYDNNPVRRGMLLQVIRTSSATLEAMALAGSRSASSTVK